MKISTSINSTGYDVRQRTQHVLVAFAISITLYSCSSTAQLHNEDITSAARRHVEFLAGDPMQGRGIPSKEIDIAAEYIAKEFENYGLEPVNGSYYQNFPLYRAKVGSGNSLTINDANGAHTMQVERDYSAFESSPTTSLTNVGVVFVGYGITSKEHHWDDYAGIDVKNKIVVAIAGEPTSDDSTFFAGIQMTPHSYPWTKLQTAHAHGAMGIIIIGDPRYSPRPDYQAMQFSAQKPRPKSIRLSQVQTDPILGINGFGGIRGMFFPNDDDLNRMITDMTTKRAPHSLVLPQTISVTVSKTDETIPVRNVIGMLRGTDDTGYIVVGAHYDHLGIENEGASAHSSTVRDSIFNGADDNASGTAGVLLSARILAGRKERPKKSILFVCFTGEEKGLYGSQMFVQSCPLNIKNCTEMINMDMIGRNHPDSISIGGGSHFPALSGLVKQANTKLDKPLYIAENMEKFYLRSDQASFAKVGIPVVFLSSGLHAEYHEPSDEVSKIDFTKVVRVSRLCAESAWMVARGK